MYKATKLLLPAFLWCGVVHGCPFHLSMETRPTFLEPIILQVANQSNGVTEEHFLGRTRQLTYAGKRTGEGYFSADGRHIVFQSEREEDNPWYQIYMMDLDTGETERISPGHGKTTCSYINQANDRYVLFASTHDDPRSLELQKEEMEFRASGKERRYSWDYDPHFDIYVFDRETREYSRVTDTKGYDAEGAYSADGRMIVFSSNRSAYTEELTAEEQRLLEADPAYFADLYLMNADGSNVRRITNEPGYDGGPFFSYDGQYIVWRRFSEDGVTADVFIADSEGENQRRITSFESMSWAPFLHPTNEYIIFASNKQGFSNFELYLVDREGMKEPVRVTHTDGFDGLPVFTPDGSQLVWTTNRKGASQLFIAEWNHAAALEALEAAPARRSGSMEQDT